MQENPDEKLIEGPHEPMLPQPEIEIPAHTIPDAMSATSPSDPVIHSTHSNTGVIIIVVLLLVNLLLGVYVFFQFRSFKMANSFNSQPPVSTDVNTSPTQ